VQAQRLLRDACDAPMAEQAAAERLFEEYSEGGCGSGLVSGSRSGN
jgi:hypothetical protein